MKKLMVQKILIKLVHYLTIAGGVLMTLFAFVLFLEAVTVFYDDTGYRWGSGGCLSWNYTSREIYFFSSIIDGGLICLAAILFTWAIWVKKSRVYIIAWVLFALVLLFNYSPLNQDLVLWIVEGLELWT